MSKISNMKGVRVAVQVPTLGNTVLDQAAPVQNTWYIVANLKNITALIASIRVNTTGETLEAKFTIEGVPYTLTGLAGAANTLYYLSVEPEPEAGFIVYAGAAWATRTIGNSAVYPLKTFMMEIRKTTATGVGNLKGSILHSQW